MTFKVDELLKAYVGVRDELRDSEKEFKAYKADAKAKMAKIELYLMQLCDELGVDNVSGGGFTAFQNTVDRVAIDNKDQFAQFLVKTMLTRLQPFMYFTTTGEFNAEGENTLNEHIRAVLDVGTLDLLTLSANKLNCKEYMATNNVMPEGVGYSQEYGISVRKGRAKK